MPISNWQKYQYEKKKNETWLKTIEAIDELERLDKLENFSNNY
jgi:hypothetical protein